MQSNGRCSSEDPSCNYARERRRRLREYAALRKTHHFLTDPHTEILPEWVIHIMENPYDQWEEAANNGEVRTILVGRVPQFNQWIKVVFVRDAHTGALHTTYADRRLEQRYGGRPWPEPQ